MAMMKTRKPKRYASGGPVDTSNFPKVINMPSTGYVAGRDPEHIYFQKNPNFVAQGATPAAVDPNSFIGDFSGGGGGASGGGTAGDSSSSSDPGGDGPAGGPGAGAPGSGDGGDSGGDAGFRRGGAVKAKKMAKGGVVKSKMGRGDGCAMRGRTKGRMV